MMPKCVDALHGAGGESAACIGEESAARQGLNYSYSESVCAHKTFGFWIFFCTGFPTIADEYINLAHLASYCKMLYGPEECNV
jgi:hypothetical protein